MKKVARKASRFFRKADKLRPLPVLAEEGPEGTTALPSLPWTPSIAENAGCLTRFRIKKKRSAPALVTDEETSTPEPTSLLSETPSQLPEMNEIRKTPRKAKSTPSLPTMQSYSASYCLSRDISTINVIFQRLEDGSAFSTNPNQTRDQPRQGLTSRVSDLGPEYDAMLRYLQKEAFRKSDATMPEVETRDFTVNSSPSVRSRVRIARSSSEIWATTDDSDISGRLGLPRQNHRDNQRIVSDLPKTSGRNENGRCFTSDGANQAPGHWFSGSDLPRIQSGGDILHSRPHQIQRSTTLIPPDGSALGRRTLSSTSSQASGRDRMEQESACHMARAPTSSAVQGKKKSDSTVTKNTSTKEQPEPAPKTLEKQTTTDWADMNSDLSDNSFDLRQLRQNLRLPSHRVLTPSLASFRQMRAAQAARATSETENNANTQANDIFFDPTPAPYPEREPDSSPAFQPRGFVGSILSLPSTPSSLSISMSSSLLRSPLPTNVIDLIHEAARRCDREFTRLRLNVRQLKKNEAEGEEKRRFLGPELERVRGEFLGVLVEFADVRVEMDELGMDVPILDVDGEGEVVMPGGGEGEDEDGETGYEADLGEFEETMEDEKMERHATVEDSDDSENGYENGYEVDESMNGEAEMAEEMAELTRFPSLHSGPYELEANEINEGVVSTDMTGSARSKSSSSNPTDYLASAALRFEELAEGRH